jgi:DNA-binding SARP family transcriptional activator/ABC-type glycerol-3-phosphate transport system substrate-binding protein
MEIQVLGPLEVRVAGHPIALGGHRQRSVLLGLVLHVGVAVSADRLIHLVWPDAPPPSARKSLQTYVARLRTVLGDEAIVSAPGGYLLRSEAVEIDACRFETLAEEGRRHLAADPEAAWDVFGAALALWRGVPASDLEVDGDLGRYVGRLVDARLAVLEDRFEAGLATGRHAALVGELSAMVDAHPLRERLWEQLLVALYRAGRQAEALAAYSGCRELLAEELGVEPSVRLQRLHVRMLQQDPTLEAPQTIAVAAATTKRSPQAPRRNPYKGLRAFREADAADFFGRERLVDDLLTRFGAGPGALVIVGPSGSGKSSVVHAGLVPALRAGRGPGSSLLVATMTPGRQPFGRLETALHQALGTSGTLELSASDHLGLLRAVLDHVDDGTELLIVVDQAEELLTGQIPESTTRAFMATLAEAVEDPHGQTQAVLTLRADFLDRALQDVQLASWLTSAAVNVPPLSAAEVQAAVLGPAAAVGLRVAPELVAELVAATVHQPTALPLLQDVLTELADVAGDGELTLHALREAGGIHGTLARRAEAIHTALTVGEQALVRRLLLRLVSVDPAGDPIRRVADVTALCGSPDASVRRRLLDTLVAARLLSYDRDAVDGRPTVELTHEAVLRAWPRYADWIRDTANDLRLAVELERGAAEWNASGRAHDYLLTGARLRLQEEVRTRTDVEVSPAADAFLAASLVQRRRAEEEAEARQARERDLERRAVRRLRAVVAALVVLVVATSGLSALTAQRGAEAERQRTAALAAASEVLVRQLSFAAAAEAARDPELGLLLALHAVRVASLREETLPQATIDALHWGIQARGIPYPVADGDLVLLSGTSGPRGGYALPVDELVSLALSAVDRQLSDEECQRFLPSDGCPVLSPELLDDLVERQAVAAAAGAGPTGLAGTQVRFGIPPEFALYRSEFAAFTERTGIEVVLVENSWPAHLIESGQMRDRVDLLLLNQPADVTAEAAAGNLIDLARYLDRERLLADYSPHLLSVASLGGPVEQPTAPIFALPFRAAVKSLIWYAPDRFDEAGYTVPGSWAELEQLSARIVADGGFPWCFAEEFGGTSGWPATDWVEDLVLREHGPEAYDAWAAGELPFTDVRIQRAFERFGELVFTDGFVRGGAQAALRTSVMDGAEPLFDDPPGCWMYHQASFLPNMLPAHAQVGENVAAFPTPPFENDFDDAMVAQLDHVVAYTDRPEVREVVRYVASPEFGTSLAKGEPLGAYLTNARFDRSHYPLPFQRRVADGLARAVEQDLVRGDGSDSMPDGLGMEPFWSAMVDYLQGGPDTLPEILNRLEAARTR